MEIVVFLDLDDTLFQTLPKCPPGESVHPAAWGRDGAPLSYMTEHQRRLLEWLNATTTLIPATARNRDAFQRVDLPFRSLAILNFGGAILRSDRTLDPGWDNRIRPQAREMAPDLQRLHAALTDFIERRELLARARLIVDYDLPLYVVVKHPQSDLAALRTIREEFLAEFDLARFFVHDNDNNLSVVPRFLGKEKAVQYILEEFFAAAPVLTLGIGDSLTDLPFLQVCDFTVLPSRCQLARRLTT